MNCSTEFLAAGFGSLEVDVATLSLLWAFRAHGRASPQKTYALGKFI
ncbi:hypothetical protein [Schaalia vaccimaxillae]|nr:hypothetical protein [Schaalia vaccimaxillae]